MYYLYYYLSLIASPFVPLFLRFRLKKGKEHPGRFGERLGVASRKRDNSKKLLWIHAASVGEANSVLPLIQHLSHECPRLQILLTTVTVTSEKLMQNKLPEGVIHQFAPVDTPLAVKRFLDYWQPDMGIMVDSEFWPNLLMEAKKRNVILGVINARMSANSFQKWQKFAPAFIRQLLQCFDFCFAGSEQDKQHLNASGLDRINAVCNLKYDAPALTGNETELASLRNQLGTRPVWLAASTHEGEESQLIQAHTLLLQDFPELLTVIVPRHAKRGDEIANLVEQAGYMAMQRSKNQPIEQATHFYIADTMGELGLFYRLSEVVFMGGSLIPHGGQNPLEPARIGCAMVTGLHYHNFTGIVEDLHKQNAIITIENSKNLAEQVKELFQSPEKKAIMIANAKQQAKSKGGAILAISQLVKSYF